jgi:hypothetical protein
MQTKIEILRQHVSQLRSEAYPVYRAYQPGPDRANKIATYTQIERLINFLMPAKLPFQYYDSFQKVGYRIKKNAMRLLSL